VRHLSPFASPASSRHWRRPPRRVTSTCRCSTASACSAPCAASASTHRRLLDDLRRAVPGIALRTTFIVGFPGETGEQFRALCDFAGEAAFDHLGVFIYSEEQGTQAAALPDDVPAALKEERRARLMEIQESISARRHRALVGRTVEVLVEGPHEDSDLILCGRTEGQAPEIDGRVLIIDAPGRSPPGTSYRSLDETHPISGR
jgi:tRNA A37 methylthiotransferase MiaB